MSTDTEERTMEPKTIANRTCPTCGSNAYQFRSQKKIAGEPAKGEPEAVATKYRCKKCGKDWRERAPM
jgi:DNA-directed RNA polymerase subunit M/transcription elongation factor TFIIS